MPIRDADMYGWNAPEKYHKLAMKLSSESCNYIQVGSNRGASGIDGLLSTAIGFAVGCNKRLSFSHSKDPHLDTLQLLKET
ncbi:unnamed protein product [Cuscuta campestris]|uniref:Uncharacterized protein n=1 Tax=Cuscuta campestris TaxID=132261 RepID=A0A484LNJ8_9ASTE|nr:unnamed protein product [Cuscuta campestris]